MSVYVQGPSDDQSEVGADGAGPVVEDAGADSLDVAVDVAAPIVDAAPSVRDAGPDTRVVPLDAGRDSYVAPVDAGMTATCTIHKGAPNEASFTMTCKPSVWLFPPGVIKMDWATLSTDPVWTGQVWNYSTCVNECPRGYGCRVFYDGGTYESGQCK